MLTPTTLSSGGRMSLAIATARYCALNFDHSGSVIGATSIWPEVERSDAFAEAAGLHQLGVVGLVARPPAAAAMASAWLVERGLV